MTSPVIPPDCPYGKINAVFGVTKSLIGDFRQTGSDSALEWTLDWDLTLAKTEAKDG